MTEEGTVVLDCRWLGIGGAGRTTELVLRGLAEAPPRGRWLLWGNEASVDRFAWPGAKIRPISADPRLLLGQRHALAVPRGDFYVFMHQQRPLRALPSAMFVYDTIPLRYGSRPPLRAMKRLFLRRVTRTSRQILTISEHSKACIVRDLGVAADRVEIIRFPYDDAFVDRVLAARSSAQRVDAALFIGGFLPHKNVPRLLSAFADTDFCRGGGQLVLVGSTPAQAKRLSDTLDHRQRAFVDVRHSCSQAELEHLYATSLFLVQPSLEEGFGLPAWEAMCSGLPVCVSDGGALPEVTHGLATPFPADSIRSMTAAIDATAQAARSFDEQRAMSQSALLRKTSPTVEDFGLQFRSIVARNFSSSR